MAYFAPAIFLNHGEGPNAVLGEKYNQPIADSIKDVAKLVDLKRTKAFIVVTAQREEDDVVITSAESPDLIYDYSNCSAEGYVLQYPAPGSKQLAEKIQDAFKATKIAARLDSERGWDHGVFIPLMLINPEANLPVVQISVLKSQDSAQNFAIGKVLYNFRKEGIVVIGSGMSYYNLAEITDARNNNFADDKVVNSSFDEFLNEVITGDVKKRSDLLNWQKAPQGLASHPLEHAEHLMPLIVSAGAAGSKPGKRISNIVFLKKFLLSAFLWDGK